MRLASFLFAALIVQAADLPDTLQIVELAQAGDTQGVIRLLAKKVDPNAAGPDGSTALLWAAHSNNLAMAQALLRAGAKPDVSNDYGATPLSEAASQGSAPMIVHLLGAGAAVDTRSNEGETALMRAAQSGSADAVSALLARGAAVDARESWKNQTALMMAAAANHAAVVRLLIERGADVNTRSTLWPPEVVRPKNGNIVSDRPKGGLTALLYAARQGSLDAARELVKAHADLNEAEPDGLTPLVIAIVNAHYDLAAFLIESGADPNRTDKYGRGALYAAVDMNSLEPSVTRPAPKETDKHTALEIAKLALAHGADPNARLTDATPGRGLSDNPDPVLKAGTTPFLRAAKTGDVSAMRLLLEHGADPALTTKNHTTPLMAASGLGWRFGDSQVPEADALAAVKLLLDLGAPVNALNDSQESALHGAAWRGGNEIAKYLVSHGADLQQRDKMDRTPLMVATGDDKRGNPGYPKTAALLQELMAQASPQ